MSYQVYKMIHIVSIVLFFSAYAVATVKQGSIKLEKILTGIALVLIFVSGMGLIARLGIPHGQPWPLWIHIKLAIWVIIGMSGHIILKRWPKAAAQFFWIAIGMLVMASYMANYKLTA
jgi:uncharacterized membrane protein SirB2